VNRKQFALEVHLLGRCKAMSLDMGGIVVPYERMRASPRPWTTTIPLSEACARFAEVSLCAPEEPEK
jgi:hypothetical protein